MKNEPRTFQIGDFIMHRRTHSRDPFWYGTIFGVTQDVFGRAMYHVEWNDAPKSSLEYPVSLIWVA